MTCAFCVKSEWKKSEIPELKEKKSEIPELKKVYEITQFGYEPPKLIYWKLVAQSPKHTYYFTKVKINKNPSSDGCIRYISLIFSINKPFS